jgi:ribosomal protein L6P/L9E
MFIPQELVVYCIKKKKNYFLLCLSISQGWGFTKICNRLSSAESFKLLFFSNAQTCFLFNMFLGFFRNYFYFLKLKGMGFKMICHPLGIILKLGFSHRAFLIRRQELAFVWLNRHYLRIEGRSLILIKNSMFRFMALKKKSVYEKKGIFLKGSTLKFKVTSKKSKF